MGPRISQAGELRSARVESLRALAALAVVISHMSYALPASTNGVVLRSLRGGGWGVDVFFVLSGYLLFLPFARAALSGERIDLRRYAINRALRILPLYYAVVVILLLLQHGGGSAAQWWRMGLFTANFYPGTVDSVDGPTWSLIVEVQFYIALPFLAAGFARLARGLWKRLAVAVVSVAGASLVLWQVFVIGEQSFDLRYSLPARMWFFSAGMLIAVLRLAWERDRPSRLRGALASPVLWWLASAPLWALSSWRYDYEALNAVAAFLIVGACVLPLNGSRLVVALGWRPLALLGVASYSLYLWHDPVLKVLETGSLTTANTANNHSFAFLIVVGLPLCIAVAFASYRLIEAPFLRYRRRWSSASAPQADQPLTEARVASAAQQS